MTGTLVPGVQSGSSPLTRGKRERRTGKRHPPGLIPAHAGKTLAYFVRLSDTPAHPRSRGENLCVEARGEIFTGSSPLTRGKRQGVVGTIASDGLIPAHAGKTCVSKLAAKYSRAHPRSRGENVRASSALSRPTGSSPLTRGKPFTGVPAADRLGLIPAHAGKTSRSASPARSSRAHPRSRGENACECSAHEGVCGSSPLTRGKRTPGHACHGPGGLIPAHAGKTACARASTSRPSAHPRSRGENYTLGGTASVCSGSSPLTRGKLMSLRIPTDTSAAHPRSRGENVEPGDDHRATNGSSPLTRGKRHPPDRPLG